MHPSPSTTGYLHFVILSFSFATGGVCFWWRLNQRRRNVIIIDSCSSFVLLLAKLSLTDGYHDSVHSGCDEIILIEPLIFTPPTVLLQALIDNVQSATGAMQSTSHIGYHHTFVTDVRHEMLLKWSNNEQFHRMRCIIPRNSHHFVVTFVVFVSRIWENRSITHPRFGRFIFLSMEWRQRLNWTLLEWKLS